MKTNHDDWVADRLAAIEPRWRPNVAHARETLDAKLMTHHRPWTWVTGAATAALRIATFIFPETRAIGQGLWNRFVLQRVDVVRVDLSVLPLHMQVTTNSLEEDVRDIDQAERKAGFRPYLPAPGVLETSPNLMVAGPIALEQTIHIRDIENALGKVGAKDVRVPAEWEGVTLRTDVGPMVAANYGEGVQILQARPIELSVPAGFVLGHFAEVAFRSIGVSWWEASIMGRTFAAHPAWLLEIPAAAVVNIQEVGLRNGTGLLIENLNKNGAVERATITVSTRDRVYSVSSRTRGLSVKIIDALR